MLRVNNLSSLPIFYYYGSIRLDLRKLTTAPGDQGTIWLSDHIVFLYWVHPAIIRRQIWSWIAGHPAEVVLDFFERLIK